MNRRYRKTIIAGNWKMNTREAPPPVEIWVIWAAYPSCCTAAALSPPPMMVKGVKLLLPVDTVIADKFDAGANSQVVKNGEIPDGWPGKPPCRRWRRGPGGPRRKRRTRIRRPLLPDRP